MPRRDLGKAAFTEPLRGPQDGVLQCIVDFVESGGFQPSLDARRTEGIGGCGQHRKIAVAR